MPKKRHQPKFSKPQSTAPASLLSTSGGGSSSSSGSAGFAFSNNLRGSNASSGSPFSARPNGLGHDDHPPSVNELLADLRRRGVGSGHSVDVQQLVAPSVPPLIRDILQLPVMPAPRPRHNFPQLGRRTSAGPAPPQSWLSGSKHAPPSSGPGSPGVVITERRPLPDAYLPEHGSLIDIALRKFALTWDFQREYWHYYVHELPTHLRVALVMYLSIWNGSGVTSADLQIILQPPRDNDDDTPHQADDTSALDESSANESFHHLDLTNCLNRSIKLTELSSLLFPASRAQADDLQDSWDLPDADTSIPKPLLPKLTHLSLALDPKRDPKHGVAPSWRHLVSFAAHLPTLTHLSLAFWPVPSLTPNAVYASVVSPQGRAIQYGGTGPYSHTLDDEWSEAVMVLKRLSKALYGLEYLDLTGCHHWFPALYSESGHDTIDWVSDWGKIELLVLLPGYAVPDQQWIGLRKDYQAAKHAARRVERHIRAKRAGRGRFITVEKAEMEEISIDDLLQDLSLG